jgi:peptidoglycan/xylan/chitin deacetylase (PgdA/CDA1 family)
VISADSPVGVAARGKGPLNLVHRAATIGTRYGLSPHRMELRLDAVLRLVRRYDCDATLPITATAVARHPDIITRYSAPEIEFAVHGYYHVDHVALTEAVQLEQLGRARKILEENGVPAYGFRAPYLRWNEATMFAVRENGFLYDTSLAIHLPLNLSSETAAYRRALDFYGATSAWERPLLPWMENGIVRIPYCLPDDESAVDRLRLAPDEIATQWLSMLRFSHARGELFTLGIHPERIGLCSVGIAAVLNSARAARPGIWIARLEHIARWWRDRERGSIAIEEVDSGRLRIRAQGPRDLTVLARGLSVPDSQPWADGWVVIPSMGSELRTDRRPFIGIHPSTASPLAGLLREQGYIVEISERHEQYHCYLRRPRFSPADKGSILARIEQSGSPLVRLGRWPNGAKSALAITGDVDALTIWDYAFRFLGQ